jgi:hypothetical protein
MEEAKEEVKAEKVNPKKEKKPRKPIDTRKGGMIWTIWHYCEAILLIVLGVLAIVFNDNTDLKEAFLIIIGGFLILDGSLRILMNFLPLFGAEDKKSLSFNFVVSGAFELAAGITLILERSAADAIALFLTYFISIILIVAGVSFLLFAIGFIATKLYHLYMPILEIILGLALIAGGVVILVYMKPNDSQTSEIFYRVVLILSGVIVTGVGLAEAVSTTSALIVENRRKKVMKAANAFHENVQTGVKDFVDMTQKSQLEQKDDNVVDAPSEESKDEPKTDK